MRVGLEHSPTSPSPTTSIGAFPTTTPLSAHSNPFHPYYHTTFSPLQPLNLNPSAIPASPHPLNPSTYDSFSPLTSSIFTSNPTPTYHTYTSNPTPTYHTYTSHPLNPSTYYPFSLLTHPHYKPHLQHSQPTPSKP